MISKGEFLIKLTNILKNILPKNTPDKILSITIVKSPNPSF